MYSIYDDLTSSDSDEVKTENERDSVLADAIRPTLQNLDCSGFLYRVPGYSPQKIVKDLVEDMAARENAARRWCRKLKPIYVFKSAKAFKALGIPPPFDNTMQLIKTENSDTTTSESEDDGSTTFNTEAFILPPLDTTSTNESEDDANTSTFEPLILTLVDTKARSREMNWGVGETIS